MDWFSIGWRVPCMVLSRPSFGAVLPCMAFKAVLSRPSFGAVQVWTQELTLAFLPHQASQCLEFVRKSSTWCCMLLWKQTTCASLDIPHVVQPCSYCSITDRQIPAWGWIYCTGDLRGNANSMISSTPEVVPAIKLSSTSEVVPFLSTRFSPYMQKITTFSCRGRQSVGWFLFVGYQFKSTDFPLSESCCLVEGLFWSLNYES